MAYRVVFIGLSVQAQRGMIPLTDGYQARAWLPNYDGVTFVTVAEAHDWISANQVGPDLATVEGLFRVEAEDAAMTIDLEERVNYRITAQTGNLLTVAYTFGSATFDLQFIWNGLDDLDRLLRDRVPIGALRDILVPPPPAPNVVGRHGHILLITIPDLT